MPSIEIQDLSEDTYEKLERLAFAAGQSVSQYVRALVLREARQQSGPPAFAGPADPVRTRRTQQAFGETADSRETRERWRDL